MQPPGCMNINKIGPSRRGGGSASETSLRRSATGNLWRTSMHMNFVINNKAIPEGDDYGCYSCIGHSLQRKRNYRGSQVRSLLQKSDP